MFHTWLKLLSPIGRSSLLLTHATTLSWVDAPGLKLSSTDIPVCLYIPLYIRVNNLDPKIPVLIWCWSGTSAASLRDVWEETVWRLAVWSSSRRLLCGYWTQKKSSWLHLLLLPVMFQSVDRLIGSCCYLYFNKWILKEKSWQKDWENETKDWK